MPIPRRARQRRSGLRRVRRREQAGGLPHHGVRRIAVWDSENRARRLRDVDQLGCRRGVLRQRLLAHDGDSLAQESARDREVAVVGRGHRDDIDAVRSRSTRDRPSRRSRGRRDRRQRRGGQPSVRRVGILPEDACGQLVVVVEHASRGDVSCRCRRPHRRRPCPRPVAGRPFRSISGLLVTRERAHLHTK